MLTLTFDYGGTQYTIPCTNYKDIKPAVDKFFKVHTTLTPFVIHSTNYSMIIHSEYTIYAKTDDNTIRISTTNEKTICIGDANLPVVPTNNGIYLVTVNRDYKGRCDYNVDLLSIVYSDISMTLTTALQTFNKIAEQRHINGSMDINSDSDFSFSWKYEGVVYLITIDHEYPTCQYLFTPEYFSRDFEYFDNILIHDTTYLQKVSMKYLDDESSGISYKGEPILVADGEEVHFTELPKHITDVEMNKVPLQGKYVHFKLVDGQPFAELISVEEFLDNMYMEFDMMSMANEFHQNGRQQVGSRTRVLYNGKKYNTLSAAYESFYRDLYDNVANEANEVFDNLSINDKNDMLKSYLYINRAAKTIEYMKKFYKDMTKDEINEKIRQIPKDLISATKTLNEYNRGDIFGNILKLQDRLKYLIKKLQEVIENIENMEDNYWFVVV